MERFAAIAAMKLTSFLETRISTEDKARFGKLLNEEYTHELLPGINEAPMQLFAQELDFFIKNYQDFPELNQKPLFLELLRKHPDGFFADETENGTGAGTQIDGRKTAAKSAEDGASVSESSAKGAPDGASVSEAARELLQTYRTLRIYEGYERIYRLLQGNPIAITLFELCVCSYMKPAYLELYRLICPGCYKGPSMELAAMLTFGEEDALSYYPECRGAWEHCQWLFPQVDGAVDFFHCSCVLDDRMMGFLSGEDRIDDRLIRFSEIFDFDKQPLAPWYGTTITREDMKLPQIREEDYLGNCMISITGEVSSGKRFLAKHIARENGLSLFMVDFEKLLDKEKSPLYWKLILREIYITPRALCMYHINAAPEEQGEILQSILLILAESLPFGKPVFLLTGENVKLLPHLDCKVIEFAIKPYDGRESRFVWQHFLEEYGLSEEIESKVLSMVMNLPAGQINKICRLTEEKKRRQGIEKNDIYRISYQVLDDGRYDSIKRVNSKYTWDDLKINQHQRALLKSICDQIEHRALILDDWNLQESFRYGRSVSAIFTGPPGTGKTMAAGVLANMLGLEIYKVDLSQIVDKYIGETEKRLEEVFNKAQKSHMILFFDEADAILGKRSEVKDAKDKYANTEVSYLLQRMEEYDGIVLMATNNYSNIDPAFIRRFRFEVPFYSPDEETRKELWNMLLQRDIPLGDVNVDYLAHTFEITGAVIKNIVLNACFDAAADNTDNPTLEMKHILRATVRELKKNGKVVIPSDLKEYGVFLE